MSVFAFALLISLAVLLLVAAVIDIRSRLIPNTVNIVIAGMAILWWLAMGFDWTAILTQIGLATAITVLFAGFFFCGWMGGGDVKLLGALALWLPLEKMTVLLVWMSLVGGVLTAAMVIAHWLRRAEGRPEIPYGVAIVGAALLVLTNDILTSAVA